MNPITYYIALAVGSVVLVGVLWFCHHKGWID